MLAQSEPDVRVVAKLQKLLAVANDERANENMAQMAMERAQALMREHNLTMATVEASGGKAEGRRKDTTQKNLMFKWQRELFEVIAKVNFCYFALVYKRTKSGEQIAGGYEIIGRESNIIGARNMYDYLTKVVARLVKEHCGTSSSAQFTKYANSFRLGLVDRLGERLGARHAEAIAEQSRQAREANAAARHPGAPTGTALMIILEDYAQVEKDLNNDLLQGFEPGHTGRVRRENAARWAAADAARAQKKADFIAQGIPDEVAYFMSWDYSREAAEARVRERNLPAKPEKVLTEAQKAKEEAKNQRYWDRVDARAAREAAKIDRRGFEAGRRSGENVGLDAQVTAKTAKRLT